MKKLRDRSLSFRFIFVANLVLFSSLTILSESLFLNPTPTQAASATTDVALTLSSAISLAKSNCPNTPNPDDTATNNHNTLTLTPTNPTNVNGSFKSDCQNLKVYANTPGYTLTAKATSDDATNNLTYQDPTSVVPAPIIPTTSHALSNPQALTNNTWGFAVENQLDFDNSYTIDNSSNTYAELPTTDATIYHTEEFPLPVTNFKFYYATRVNSATAAGHYATTITYTVIGEMVPCQWDSSISFEDVNCVEPGPPSTPPPSTATKTTAIVPNFASTVTPTGNGTGTNGPQFSIAGSNFTASPTVTIDGQSCTDITVNSAGTAITCSGPTTNMTDGEKRVVINSVDAGDDYTVFYSSYTFPTLQSLTSATCDTTPTVYRDTRDSQLYYVAKLADNKCWMLDNLKYKPNGDTTGTNQSGFSAVQVANTGAGNYLTQNGNSGTGNPNQDAAKYIDPIPQSYCYNNTDKPAHNITKCGLLYNYYTATAGTNLQANFDASNRNAAGSICPANWRLPSGYNADGDFGVLDKAYSGGTGVGRNLSNPDTQGLWLYSGAFASVYSGTYDSSFNDQGLTSFFLSSSAYNNLSAYSSGVSIPSWYVNPGAGTNARRYGIAVRCVIGL